ncbi:hypothetical protein C2845_PM03G33540 [Panicum miliaceum]|uniref:Uncharacterized protein n=1 Tax=Panicum miliaceum TaxID=4540 RepID=A0A3L6TE88_PANMI|nr:hypothetical protein C2845_PM03G33540 [Panicum miliaceum]
MALLPLLLLAKPSSSMLLSCLTSPSSRSWRKATPSRSWTSPASSAAGDSPPSRSSPPRAEPAFVRAALAKGGAGDAAVIELPFPDGGAGAEGRIEGVASASSFSAFAEATTMLRPGFEEALSLPCARAPASLLVADGFLY